MIFQNFLSSYEDEPVPKGQWNGAPGFQQRLEVRLGSLLKAENGLPAVSSVGMAARKQPGFGNPSAVLVLAQVDFGNRYYHGA